VERLKLQRKTNSDHEQENTFNASLIEQAASNGSGQALDPAVRATLEPQFGHSFADVRVFSDAQADRMARDVNATAFTVGQDMFFRAGEYNPESMQGRHLLAHELTHTIQQRGARPSKNLEISTPGESQESEANLIADAAMSGQAVEVGLTSGAMISRREDEKRKASFPDPNQSIDPPEYAPQSNPNAPTSHPGDIPSEPDPMSDVPEHDPLSWLATKGIGKALGKLFGVPGGIIMGTLGMESDESPEQREARKRQENE
jgi:Domain of unknown function (DUF4157)